jgi:tetratricopeptide (TPR) repeat protein
MRLAVPLKSLDMDPLHADTWYDKLIILKEIKEYDEALQCFEKALTLKPEHKEALKS